jgi:ribonuclease R
MVDRFGDKPYACLKARPINTSEKSTMKDKNRTTADKETLLKIFRREKKPLSIDDLKGILNLHRAAKQDVRKGLKELLREGGLVRLRNNRYGLPDELNLEVGTLWCTKSGNGFVIPDKGREGDVFVPSRCIGNALHGDKVVVRIEHTSRGKKEGRIVRVTEHRIRNILGFLKQHKDFFFLIPEDDRISSHFLVESNSRTAKARDGDLAACRITRFPDNGGDPECKVLKLFKGLNDVASISQFTMYKHDLPLRFKPGIEKEAKEVAAEQPFEVVRRGDGIPRLDLRKTKHVTIDGEYAKDFDDAVLIRKTKKGYELFVSIADVSHYVKPGARLDDEAYSRGTSVYFPGSVIPMLPNVLSNGMCSLKPDEDRLTVTARLLYSSQGDLLETSFSPSIIRSAHRLTYTAVEQAIVKKDPEVRKSLKGVLKELESMGELALLLKQKRQQKGNLDIDLPEPEVIHDMECGVQDILRSERLFSHQIIEEFMIAANEAIAQFLEARGVPLVFRIHEPPEKEKLHDFENLLATLGIEYRKASAGGLLFQSILESVKDREHEFLINRILLRSMKQAKYSARNEGHFGLGLASYAHFTSPIRRYPDLIVHRILKEFLASGKSFYDERDLERMSVQLSERERTTMEAERELEDRIRALFMKERIGSEYGGIISHITSYGFFVELFDVFVEGVVPLSSLGDDYYAFEENKFRLIGRRTRKIYRIGDKVKVRVAMADVEKNMLRFDLLSESNAPNGRGTGTAEDRARKKGRSHRDHKRSRKDRSSRKERTD